MRNCSKLKAKFNSYSAKRCHDSFGIVACFPSRSADGDVAVEAGDDGGVDRGRHGDLRDREERGHGVRVHVSPVGVAQRPAKRQRERSRGLHHLPFMFPEPRQNSIIRIIPRWLPRTYTHGQDTHYCDPIASCYRSK